MAPQMTEIRKNSSNDFDQKLYKYFMPDFRKGYIEVTDQKYCLPVYYKDFADRIENFEVYDSDTFVVSFPKTGTTWTQEMVWCIGNNLDFKAAEQLIQDRFPFLEVTALFDYRTTAEKDPTFHLPEFITESIGYVQSKPHPRFIKSHLPWELLPRQIRNGTKQPRIIYVTRNPKDTCVSYYHHCSAYEGFSGDLTDFAELFVAGRVSYAPFWRHVAGFSEQRNRDNILLLRYEEMKRDLPAVLRRVAGFLGCALSAMQVEQLEQHLSFEAMRGNKAVNYEPFFSETQTRFMRVGKIGSYRKEMTVEMIEKFDKWTSDTVQGDDLNF